MPPGGPSPPLGWLDVDLPTDGLPRVVGSMSIYRPTVCLQSYHIRSDQIRSHCEVAIHKGWQLEWWNESYYEQTQSNRRQPQNSVSRGPSAPALTM